MKTKPHTIRFEESDYNFISKRENLKTAQSIVSFLVGEYMKLYKIEKKSVFDYSNTTESIKNSTAFTDRLALNKVEIEEPKSYYTVPVNQFDAYVNDLNECTMISQVVTIMNDVKKCQTLAPSERIKLEIIAKEISKDFFTD